MKTLSRLKLIRRLFIFATPLLKTDDLDRASMSAVYDNSASNNDDVENSMDIDLDMDLTTSSAESTACTLPTDNAIYPFNNVETDSVIVLSRDTFPDQSYSRKGKERVTDMTTISASAPIVTGITPPSTTAFTTANNNSNNNLTNNNHHNSSRTTHTSSLNGDNSIYSSTTAAVTNTINHPNNDNNGSSSTTTNNNPYNTRSKTRKTIQPSTSQTEDVVEGLSPEPESEIDEEQYYEERACVIPPFNPSAYKSTLAYNPPLPEVVNPEPGQQNQSTDRLESFRHPKNVLRPWDSDRVLPLGVLRDLNPKDFPLFGYQNPSKYVHPEIDADANGTAIFGDVDGPQFPESPKWKDQKQTMEQILEEENAALVKKLTRPKYNELMKRLRADGRAAAKTARGADRAAAKAAREADRAAVKTARAAQQTADQKTKANKVRGVTSAARSSTRTRKPISRRGPPSTTTTPPSRGGPSTTTTSATRPRNPTTTASQRASSTRAVPPVTSSTTTTAATTNIQTNSTVRHDSAISLDSNGNSSASATGAVASPSSKALVLRPPKTSRMAPPVFYFVIHGKISSSATPTTTNVQQPAVASVAVTARANKAKRVRVDEEAEYVDKGKEADRGDGKEDDNQGKRVKVDEGEAAYVGKGKQVDRGDGHQELDNQGTSGDGRSQGSTIPENVESLIADEILRVNEMTTENGNGNGKVWMVFGDVDDNVIASYCSSFEQKYKYVVTKKKGAPQRIPPTTENFDKLAPQEVAVCETLRLDPTAYLRVKDTILKGRFHKTSFTKRTAQGWCCVDVNKVGKVFDWFLSMGWIESGRGKRKMESE
ncbi:Transcriptional adapter ada2 [Blyttiomyces sp. JEL0837]|nr:Transcriptional adapter ada2 [Blyttiomyces sp. JEL0837]